MSTRSGFAGLWAHRCPPAGSLGSYIDRFADRLTERGYGQRAAQGSAGVVADFGCWLERKGLGAADIDECLLDRFHRHYLTRPRYSYLGARAALREFLFLLREMDVCRARTPVAAALTPSDRLVCDFEQHLLRERGMTPGAIANQAPIVRRFLRERCGGEPLRLATLSGESVTGFVRDIARECAGKGQSRCHVQHLCSALRTFLRYLVFRGEIATDLSGSVPSVADRRFSTLPKFLPPEQVQKILGHCNRKSARGKRDYAVLLLLARLGLRAGEVASLLLDDIDWHAGQLRIRGKGRQRAQMPLPKDVGEAIADYVQHSRPSSLSRKVFLRHNAPYVGFLRSKAVSSIVERALTHAGIARRDKGAHLLRHSLATSMLSAGASLTEIGHVLRHRRHDTTRIYAKVDLTALRRLALAWPGGAQ